MLARLCLALLLATPSVLLAKDLFPTITHVTENSAGTEITISGDNFGNKTPKVFLGGMSLVVLNSNNSTVTAKLPAGIAPGSYALLLYDEHNQPCDPFIVTLGAVGPVGPAGPAGAAGATGPMGLPGPAGPAGPKGPTGATGPAGPMGTPGAAGPAGPAGPMGLTGPAGPAGPMGSTGPAGPMGSTGPAGPAGPMGSTGPAGPAGPIGSTGPAGPAGPMGSTGPAGPAGPMGSTGPAGPDGPPGPPGPVGPAGTLSLSGSIFTATITNPGGGPAGEIYYIPPSALISLEPGANSAIASSTEANFVVVPAPCTVSALNVGANNYYSPGSDSVTIKVYKNSAATAMVCTTTVDNNGSSCTDSTDTFSVAGGDTLSIAFSETNINPFVRVTTTLICQ